MRWVLKAALQKALGEMPGGGALNYVFQRHVTRKLPRGEVAFRRKFMRAVRHFDAFAEHGAVLPDQAHFYEFGVGWDLIIALTYRALGVNQQTLVDIRRNVRLSLVNETLAHFERVADDLEARAGRALRPLGRPTLASYEELGERYGIEYLAPRDPRATELPAGSIDFVSSTATLEHVRADDIGPLLAECLRLLKPDGLMRCAVDLHDHFSYFDKTLSPYNFLRFSDRTWRLLTSPLNYQNRLRYPDYIELLQRAGFEIVAERVGRPPAEDIETLRRLPLAEPFRDRYSFEELNATSLRVVARPARSPNAQ